jgi:hypothetical protein
MTVWNPAHKTQKKLTHLPDLYQYSTHLKLDNYKCRQIKFLLNQEKEYTETSTVWEKFREQSCTNAAMPEDVIYDRTHRPRADIKSCGNSRNTNPPFNMPENIRWPKRTLLTTPVQPLPNQSTNSSTFLHRVLTVFCASERVWPHLTTEHWIKHTLN